MEHQQIPDKNIFETIRIERTALTSEKKEFLKQRLDLKIQVEKKHRRNRSIFLFSKIVACMLLLIGIGISSVYYLKSNDPISDYDQYITEALEEFNEARPHLIRFNGEHYLLDKKEILQFSQNGNINIYDNQHKIRQTIAGSTSLGQTPLSRLVVPNGSTGSVVLVDGTKIWANSGTVIVFPEKFEDRKRQIYVEGEAYLEVAPDKQKPFLVQTKRYEVKVLGTSFNVSSYSSEPNPAVVLVSGQVEMNHNGQKIQMEPNEKVEINNGNILKTSVRANDYISWRNGILTFRNEPLLNVLQKLSRYYNLELQHQTIPQGFMCSGKLNLNDDINKVLESIKATMSIELKLTDGKLSVR